MAWRYVREGLDVDLAPGAVVELTGDEAHHAAVVARIAPGERISMTDGEGLVAEGVVTRAAKDLVAVTVDAVRREPEPSPRLVLVQALAKGGRDELAVQTATELGVSAIIPWQAARSVSRWDAKKAPKQVARWQAIAREAAKQSLRAHIPAVANLADTAALGQLAGEAGTRVVVLSPEADQPLVEWATSELAEGARGHEVSDVLLVVGPEGGITPAEQQRLVDRGAVALRLGSPVLRTSTAGPAAVTALSIALGRWGRIVAPGRQVPSSANA